LFSGAWQFWRLGDVKAEANHECEQRRGRERLLLDVLLPRGRAAPGREPLAHKGRMPYGGRPAGSAARKDTSQALVLHARRVPGPVQTSQRQLRQRRTDHRRVPQRLGLG
jgi:hypothetical protein